MKVFVCGLNKVDEMLDFVFSIQISEQRTGLFVDDVAGRIERLE